MKHLSSFKNSSHRRGVTLLIAVLVLSAVLSVGLGVFQRVYKELYFASFWKQTQIAGAAADSGLECALYWDLHPSATPACFGTPISTWVAAASSATYTDSGVLTFANAPTPRCSCDNTATGQGYECGSVVGSTYTGVDLGPACYDWWNNSSGSVPSRIWNRTAVGGASMPSGDFELNTYGGCVNVTITKPAPSGASTLIEARGYNDACGSTNPRRVERGLNIEY